MSSSLIPLKTRVHVKYVEAQTSSHWCGVEVRRNGYQLRCRARHLAIAQNCKAKSPRVAEYSSPGGATAYQLLHRSIHRQAANRVAKNVVNLALSPTFRYVFIES
ncbi:hypothetical protein TNCV_4597071 [Trichonephila clavipes]|uniref:Uncharacterized protein n=1 Tax=Trichonephila clavipes TaxID=2585209 RepID=A0A8X6WFM1_TRICX|nr:hypothetical protein TNCV_4597071 [Trichonephila clavipes]